MFRSVFAEIAADAKNTPMARRLLSSSGRMSNESAHWQQDRPESQTPNLPVQPGILNDAALRTKQP
jgi:hypothetical protein